MSSRSAREIKSDKRGMAQEKKKLRSAKKEIPPPNHSFVASKSFHSPVVAPFSSVLYIFLYTSLAALLIDF